MVDPRKEFEIALLVDRVVTRVSKSRLAKEECRKYLGKVDGWPVVCNKPKGHSGAHDHIEGKTAAGKRPTFEKARADVMAYFDKDGWQASSPTLKVPHVTSPDGGTRLWFKPQAVYFTTGKHDLGSARSLHIDIRDVTPEEVMKTLQRFSKV